MAGRPSTPALEVQHAGPVHVVAPTRLRYESSIGQPGTARRPWPIHTRLPQAIGAVPVGSTARNAELVPAVLAGEPASRAPRTTERPEVADTRDGDVDAPAAPLSVPRKLRSEL